MALAPYRLPVTTSILDENEIARLIKAMDPATPLGSIPPATESPEAKPVSLAELAERAKGLFTPEEAEALARRIEESCERLDD